MSLFNGENISVEIFGESHAPNIGVICKGFPKVKIDRAKLTSFMDRRKPSKGSFSTQRREPDEVVFEKGVNDFHIVDDEFCAVIKNVDTKSKDYDELYGKPRPSHADFCAFKKFGTLSFTGGGKFSARLTAPLCIAGGIAKQILEGKGITIKAYLSQIGEVRGKSYKDFSQITEQDIVCDCDFPSLSRADEMQDEINKAREDLDSVGGVVECVVFNLPVGLGDSYFDGLEGKIASAVYAVPAVKGVEFGLGFDLSKMRGSKANDQFYFEGDEVKTRTNNSGGINGGISNGMPITMSVAFRPTPSIARPQKTVDLVNEVDTEIAIKGRHDSAVAVRAVPVVEAVVAICLLDILMTKGE